MEELELHKYKDFENFWYYNKFKLLGAIITVAVIVVLVITGGSGAKPDVEIAYATDGRTISQEAEEYMNQCFAPVIKDINGDNNKVTAFVPLQGARIDLEFVAEGSQIVLVDGGTLSKFVRTGVFEPLDDYTGKCKIDFDKYPGINLMTETDEKAHTYAIPMEYIPLLLDIGFPSENYYLTKKTVNNNSSLQEKGENADHIIDLLLMQKAN